MPNISDIGTRGLVISDDNRFFYVSESDWRQRTALSAAPRQEGQPDPETLVDLGVAVAKLSNSAFINLDALANLEPSEMAQAPAPVGRTPGSRELDAKGVLLYENKSFYMVPASMWKPLAPNAEGDAGVLVKRGAVVAAVPPNDIPTGTFCVLVNWNGLFNG